MEHTLEVTYTKKHTITLEESSRNYITQAIYDTFTRELSDYIDNGDVDTVPGDTLKKIFNCIATDMLTDDEFWGD